MGIREDTEDFNNTGLRGLLRALMRERDEGYVRELPGGWSGEIVSTRPLPGTGPLLHYRRGYSVLRYRNMTPDDTATEEYRVEV